MIQFRLLDTVKEALPDFDGENPSNLIKAEKILKAELKAGSGYSMNDIERFISFFRKNGNRYSIFLQDENLSKILNYEYFKINSGYNRIFPNIMEITPDFRLFCEEPVKDFMQVNIRHHDWENLRIFYENYFPVISPSAKEFLMDQLTQKNNLIRSVIPQYDCYYYLTDPYRHSINPHFYGLQSDIDSAYFNEEILDINNDISDYQHTEAYLKIFLGKILVALGHFDAYTEDLRQILENNSKIGAAWIAKGSPFFPKFIENETKQTNQEIEQSIIDFRRKIAKKAAVSEWTIAATYYLIIFAIFAALYQMSERLFAGVFVSEIIIFLSTNKRMNKEYGKRYEAKDQSLLGKNKKFGYKLMKLQLYIITIGTFLMIFAGFIYSWCYYPLFGVVFTIVFPYLIRKEIHKMKHSFF